MNRVIDLNEEQALFKRLWLYIGREPGVEPRNYIFQGCFFWVELHQLLFANAGTRFCRLTVESFITYAAAEGQSWVGPARTPERVPIGIRGARFYFDFTPLTRGDGVDYQFSC